MQCRIVRIFIPDTLKLLTSNYYTGISTSLEQREKRGKRTFTCTNPLCKKTFNSPLKTKNLQKRSTEPFDACPYCLTRITVARLEPDYEPENIADEPSPRKEKLSQNKENPPSCKYHLGYLSEREQKEQIPDECICCKDILECMLKKMRQ